MSEELKGVWAVLKEIKAELIHIDDKWEDHIKERSSDRTKIDHLCSQVDNIEKLLTRGNGQKSVLVQLEHLGTELHILKSTHKELKTANDKDHALLKSVDGRKLTDAEVKKARYFAIAKVAGVFALAIPGLLALLGLGG